MAIKKSDYQRIFTHVFTRADELLTHPEAHSNALSQYLASWEEIAEKAVEVDNFALQDVLLIFIDLSHFSFQKVQKLDETQFNLLNKWDDLFGDYIESPENLSAAKALISCLNDPLLAAGLLPKDEKYLLDAFEVISEQLILEEAKTVGDFWQQLSNVFDKTESNLNSLLAHQTAHDSSAFSESLQQYFQNWHSIANILELELQQNEKWLNLLNISLLFIDVSSHTFDRIIRFTNEQKAILTRWHNLFDSYLKTRGSQQIALSLIKCLSNSIWPNAISAKDEEMLLQELGVVLKSNQKITPLSPTPSSEKKAFDIWVSIETPFLNALESLKSLQAYRAPKEAVLFTNALEQYQQHWQQIVEYVSQNEKQSALLDTLSIFVALNESIFVHSQALSDKQSALLKKWHNLFSSYLKARGNKTLAISLVKCLSDVAWETPINEEDEAVLLAAFNPNKKKAKEVEPKIVESKLPKETPQDESLSELEKFWQTIAELVDEAALNLKAAIDYQIVNQENEFSQKLHAYSDNWNAIAKHLAKDESHVSLLDVVLLFNEIRYADFEQLHDLSSQQFDALNTWQHAFIDYHQNPYYSQARQLTQCLSNLVWQDAIESNDVEMLLQGFELEQPQKKQNVESIKETPIQEKETPLSQLIDIQSLSIWQKIEPIFTQAVNNLKVALDQQIIHNTAAFSSGLDRYLTKWMRLSDILAEDESQAGLYDVVLLFIEISRQSFEQLDSLNSEHFSLLNTWHDYFDDYIKTAGTYTLAIHLIHCLNNPLWSEGISSDDEAMLLEGFNYMEISEQNDSFDEISEQENITPVKQKHPVWEKIQSFFSEADKKIQSIEELLAENKATQCLEYSYQYINHWLIIADIISEQEDENLFSLTDSSFVFADNFTEILEKNIDIDSHYLHLMQAWHLAFETYLDEPENPQFFTLLIDVLKDNHWSRPLTIEDQEMLIDMLSTEDGLMFADDNAEELLFFNQEDATNSDETFGLMFAEEEGTVETEDELMFADELEYDANLMFSEEIEAVNEPDTEELFFSEETQELENEVNEEEILFSEELNLVDNTEAAKAESLFLEELQESEVDSKKLLFPEEIQESEANNEALLFPEELDAVDELQLEDPQEPEAGNKELLFPEELELVDNTEKVEAESLFLEELQESEVDSKELLFPEEIQEPEINNEALLFPEELEDKSIQEAPELVDSEVIVETKHVNPELIGMVKDEFDILVKELSEKIDDIADTETFKNSLKEHHFKFENLATACNTIGLLALEKVFNQLSINMRSRRDTDPEFSEIERRLFVYSLPLIQEYIAAVNNSDKAQALIALLQAPDWKEPLNEHEAEKLTLLFEKLVVNSPQEQEQLSDKITTAEPSDVSLELPQDVNQELLEALLSELPLLTGNFSAVIQKIISTSSERNVSQLLEAQRIAHTLKGSGNIVGIAGISVVTHHLEEILEYLTEQQIFPSKVLGGVLLEAADCLELMSDVMLSGEWHAPEQALGVLQNVLNWSNKISSGGLSEENLNEQSSSTLPAEADTNTAPVIQVSKTETGTMTRVSSKLVDNLLRMTGEGSILSEQFKERINGFSEELKNLNSLTWQMQSLVSDLDQSINLQSYGSQNSNNNEFDALEMEQYNELHTAASRITEVATDIRELNIIMEERLVELKYLMIDEDNIQKENQAMVQSIRMVAAKTISSRCQRIVRQACRTTNKEVELEIKGENLLIDSEILNSMVDPLMHLLRNSVDHGIEPAHIRERENKDPVGKITLEFIPKGNYATISCKDDGGGLSSGNILQTAIKKGLITADQTLSEAEIHKLILIPGFSTRAVATQVSGRGIGMDAIQTKISALQGQMSLASTRGQGLSIDITIPLTLSSILSLLVKANGQTMAISNRGLHKIYHANECHVIKEDGQLYCEINYERFPARYFTDLLGMSTHIDEQKKSPALRIEDEIGKTSIVFVDELLGYKDLLVKGMGDYIPHIKGITGASILGNGAIAPVIDLVELLHNSAKYDYLLADATKGLADNITGLPLALVVDDSLSARRAVAMLLEDSGIQVETAIDGLDAIKQIEKAQPDILVLDLEMPRMNGIELAAHIRGRENMQHTPIIMITSRATEKHRRQAEAAGVTRFMTKPFSEDKLINNIRGLMES